MNAPIQLPDPRLTGIERRLTAVEACNTVHRSRIDALADVVAPHPTDAETAAFSERYDAVLAVQAALDSLTLSVRRLIEASRP